MRLQKQLSRVHKDKVYPKYTIVVPPKEIEKLRWEEGNELTSELIDGKLIIKRSNKKEE